MMIRDRCGRVGRTHFDLGTAIESVSTISMIESQ
jgi:hypothetical protein